MSDRVLGRRFDGPLKIVIHTLSGEIYDWTLCFDRETLFVYVGEACARIFTNMTTRPVIETKPGDWKVLLFDPVGGKLEVQQIGGDNLTVEADDPKKMDRLLGIKNKG